MRILLFMCVSFALGGAAGMALKPLPSKVKAVETVDEHPAATLEFLGVTWSDPHPIDREFMPAWSYTNDDFPGVQVIDQRKPSGELHSRWTEARRGRGPWQQHGIHVYYGGRDLIVSEYCSGEAAENGAMLPMQDFEPQTCEDD